MLARSVTFSPASISVDRASPVPLYFQVAQQLERAVESGELPPGTRLENEIALADQLGLSRPTVRRAIEYLVDRGLLVRKRGIGTQVVHPKVRRPLELTSLYEDLTAHGKRPGTKVLSLGSAPAPDFVAHALGMDEAAPVVRLQRLRYAQGEPLALMCNFVPEGLVPQFADARDHILPRIDDRMIAAMRRIRLPARGVDPCAPTANPPAAAGQIARLSTVH